jgi:hypothetical protein
MENETTTEGSARMEKVTAIRAIKTYFELDGGKRVSMTEMKNLTNEDRVELGGLAAVELGMELVIK